MVLEGHCFGLFDFCELSATIDVDSLLKFRIFLELLYQSSFLNDIAHGLANFYMVFTFN